MANEQDIFSRRSSAETVSEVPTDTTQSNVDTHLNTPTHTTSVEPTLQPTTRSLAGYGLESVPWPGSTFMIRHRASDKILAREKGVLVLKDAGDLAFCGWRWTCVENDGGWLGFYETSSGVYLGRDGYGGIRASAPVHKSWEALDVRRHPSGGYQILSIHWWTRRRMAVDMKTGTIVEIDGREDKDVEATLWDFEKLEP